MPERVTRLFLSFMSMRRVRHWSPVITESESHRMNPVGVNSWVWPPTDAAIAEIAPRVDAMGFDLLEMSVENSGEWDPPHTAIWRRLAKAQDALAQDGLRFLRDAFA